MSDVDSGSVSPFACVMEAIAVDKRQEHLSDAKYLFGRVVEIRELPVGFAFRVKNEPNVLARLGNFIELERLCCPFFGFGVEVEAEGGAIWLSLIGREGVKPFIHAEIGELRNGLFELQRQR